MKLWATSGYITDIKCSVQVNRCVVRFVHFNWNSWAHDPVLAGPGPRSTVWIYVAVVLHSIVQVILRGVFQVGVIRVVDSSASCQSCFSAKGSVQIHRDDELHHLGRQGGHWGGGGAAAGAKAKIKMEKWDNQKYLTIWHSSDGRKVLSAKSPASDCTGPVQWREVTKYKYCVTVLKSILRYLYRGHVAWANTSWLSLKNKNNRHVTVIFRASNAPTPPLLCKLRGWMVL